MLSLRDHVRRIRPARTGVSRRALIASASLAGWGLLAASPGCAAQGDAATAQPPASEIETIVVTAQKRAQDVQKVPMSMTVVDNAQLGKFQIHDLVGLQDSIPGLVIHTSPVNNGIYLRGFGTSPANPTASQSVSVYEDGNFLGLARQMMAPFFDVDRVEVLRGPQGALLGKNTAAGAISIVTADPTPTFSASATASYNFDRSGPEYDGFVSGPLSDTLRARVAVQLFDLGGYIRNVGADRSEPSQKSAFGRLGLRWDPSGDFHVTTKLEYGKFTVVGSPTVLISGTHPTDDLPTTKDEIDGLDYAPFGGGSHTRQNGYNGTTLASWSVGRGLTLESITAYSGFRSTKFSDGAPINPERFDVLWAERFNQQSEELRLLSPTGGRFEFIAGVYGDRAYHRFRSTESYDVLGGFLVGQETFTLKEKSYTWSAFGNVTWHVTDAARLVGSVRYTGLKKTGDFVSVADFGIPIGNIVTLRDRIRENHVDPSISAQYDLAPGAMVYASYARGSKAGGFDPGNPAINASNFTFKAEKSTSYEIGLKSKLFSRRVLLDLSAFILKFDDLQVAGFDPATLGLSTTNAASATSKGVEATVAWQALDHLRFSLNGAYTHATYDNYPGSKCIGILPASRCDPATNTENIKGVVLQYVPRWSGDLQMDYSHALSAGLTGSLSIAAKYRSGVWIDDNNYDPNVGYQKRNVKLDVRLQVAGPSDRWNVALVGRNVTDVKTKSYAYSWPLEPEPSGAPRGVAVVEETRTIALAASVKF